jgi:uncharacterized membrane protein YdjX (TVP38/TMEM64 family)
MKRWLRSYWKWIALALVVVTLSVASTFLSPGHWIRVFSDWMDRLGPFAAVVFSLLYALATVLLVPGAVRTIAAGMLFGLALGALAAWSGAVLGAALAFLIGRHLARSRIEAVTRGNTSFEAIDDAIGKQGWKIIGLLRLSPLIPFNLSNYVYGITKVGFWPYVLASAIGMVPGTLLYAYLGAAARAGMSGPELQRHPLQLLFFAVGLAATLGAVIWIARIAKRSLEAAGASSQSAE